MPGEDTPNLSGYGYTRACQDGYNENGFETVSAEDHWLEEMLQAANEILDARAIEIE